MLFLIRASVFALFGGRGLVVEAGSGGAGSGGAGAPPARRVSVGPGSVWNPRSAFDILNTNRIDPLKLARERRNSHLASIMPATQTAQTLNVDPAHTVQSPNENESQCLSPLQEFNRRVWGSMATHHIFPSDSAGSNDDLSLHYDASQLHKVLVSCPYTPDHTFAWKGSSKLTEIVEKILKTAHDASKILLFRIAIDDLQLLRATAATKISEKCNADKAAIDGEHGNLEIYTLGSERDKSLVGEAKARMDTCDPCKPGHCKTEAEAVAPDL